MNARRQMYVERLSLEFRNTRNMLPVSLLDQLDRCHSDVERRIILGISTRDDNAPEPEQRFRGKLRSLATD